MRLSAPRAARARPWRARAPRTLGAALFVCVTLSVLCGTSSAAPDPATESTAATVTVPSSGAFFGAFVNPNGTGQTTEDYGAFETALGRQLDMDRIYATWDSVEPNYEMVWDVANGIIPLISIDPTTATGPVPWARVASGADDATIVAQAKGLASLGAPVFLSFDHEANIVKGYGTAADFVAAYRRYVTLVRRYAPNVSSVLILNAAGYNPNNIAEWYPGDGYVDWVGADGYNHYDCGHTPRAWVGFNTLFKDFNAFAVAHDKPAVVSEWGSVEDPAMPGRKAAWITAAGQTMERWPQIKAVSYFDSYGTQAACDWELTSSASSMRAFAQLAQQSYFQVRPRIGMTPNPSIGAAPLSVTFDFAGTAETLHPIASWRLDFGDGKSVSGSGRPTKLDHTYAAGDFTARLSITDSAGQTNSASATVLTAPPGVTSGATWPVSYNSATLHGQVGPNGLDTTFKFAWGTVRSLGNDSTETAAGAGTTTVPIALDLRGLTPGTTYYWRVDATSAAGASQGALESFTTKQKPPN